MPLRLRKFIGAVALFVLVIVWALVAMALAQMPAIHEHAIIAVAYYVIAGIGWCLPAIPIVTWMSGSGASRSENRDQ
jgi:fumarate hydratase class II